MSFTFRDAALNTHNPTARGFTLVELIIVIVVIGILAGISFVAYSGVRRTASEAAAKSELSGSSKGFNADQILVSTQNNPSGSPYLYRETPSNIVTYAHGDTQSYCMEVKSKTDSTVTFYQFSGLNSTPITPGTCPTPNYRTAYRCIAGNVYSTYTLVNTLSRSVSFKINHSSSGTEENYSSIAPSATKTGTTNLRTTSVQRGVITFSLFDATTNNFIDTYYQASPAMSC
jgi:prepilin-type N-terminal cleavage/methylation domain-containing protein